MAEQPKPATVTLRRCGAVALALLAAGCVHSPPAEPASIGTATMAPDRSFTLDIASKECNGMIAHGHFVYAPGDPHYAEVIGHIGGLEPGQSKPVPPWPAPPCK